MIRLLLLALLLLSFGMGLRRGWLEIRWDRIGQDLQRSLSGQPGDGQPGQDPAVPPP
ncbi:MAG: hypothetical protein VKM68_03835 [Cyanobacteriota bacterium]|nr:hypothetical protein [Cyanobacteriota bacterium]